MTWVGKRGRDPRWVSRWHVVGVEKTAQTARSKSLRLNLLDSC